MDLNTPESSKIKITIYVLNLFFLYLCRISWAFSLYLLIEKHFLLWRSTCYSFCQLCDYTHELLQVMAWVKLNFEQLFIYNTFLCMAPPTLSILQVRDDVRGWTWYEEFASLFLSCLLSLGIGPRSLLEDYTFIVVLRIASLVLPPVLPQMLLLVQAQEATRRWRKLSSNIPRRVVNVVNAVGSHAFVAQESAGWEEEEEEQAKALQARRGRRRRRWRRRRRRR